MSCLRLGLKVVDIFDLFQEASACEVRSKPELLIRLLTAVEDLRHSSCDFQKEPDLTMIAYAITDLLDALGESSGALVAERWALYEASGRRMTKVKEARARAERNYRADLEDIGEPPPRTMSSRLPWIFPD